MYLGVDIGGTFTDLVMLDENGDLVTTKALSTPGELEVGVFNAVEDAARQRGMTGEELLARVVAFGHGTTQATNAVIERDGARTGLVTTRGFGDTLAIQRLMGFTAGVPTDRLGWYSRRRYPQPIVPRHLVREVRERVDHAGRVLVALDEAEVCEAVRSLVAEGVQTFAVSFLWAFKNAEHERIAAQIIRDEAPGAYVSLSSEIAPVLGEYERTATAALNSYLAPKVVGYLDGIEQMLRRKGFTGAFSILNSAGGVMPVAEAARRPVTLVTSGPTGGVMGSIHLAKKLGYRNIITTDMGGTSFDVAIVVDDKPLMSTNHEAGGFHIATPMIEVRAIGAGGGSIARVVDGQLRVGPDSASAWPGPACYGRGGVLPTVTDADVVLGIIDPDTFLGGKMKLDREAARAAIEDHIARPLGFSVEQAAAGIRRIVDAQMADTLREVTIGRGFDPRDFVIFAYGGAGPVHCAGYGAELGVPRMVVPVTSMAHSAYGALAADLQFSTERALLMRGGGGARTLDDGLDAPRIAQTFAELEAECLDAMDRAGVKAADVALIRTADLGYRRQTNDLIIQLDAGPVTASVVADLVRRFENTYEQTYGKGSAFREAGIELTNIRVEAFGKARRPEISLRTPTAQPKAATRSIFEPVAGQWMDCAVYNWRELPMDFQVEGPAVIEHPETSVFVAATQIARLDANSNITIEEREESRDGRA
ncbi:hydantoinase/oxoprolinase family protein [Paracoccus yeei]|uniref:Hydantoinase/oxoprolinase family protein n=1 Tax=Paracoccus yeei TaxID=147645 RepID=A0A5P2QW15_9RHOB|nr:hydantoinase/oxoprolinase family protein [Paracoccus yeei]MBY0138097.1 hydantoinase/oxoprolinase family protein [Paracoccus yeei]QEU10284.1 hydantoinase/oxoprolinase family protein [Paracoccus yeei]